MTGAGADSVGRSSVLPTRRPSLRDANLREVLRTVAAADDPPSRADVAAATGLTRSTVSRLVDDLVSAGLVDELAPRQGPGRGRPGTPLAPGRRVTALGLQVNPGYLAARALDLRGRTVVESYVNADLVNSDPAKALRRLDRMARRLLRELPSECTLTGAVIALPGIVSVAQGKVLSAPNLGWTDVRVDDFLQSSVGDLRLRVGNEADLAALTVAQQAPGRTGRVSDFLYVSGEIGIGGAAVVAGRVFPGRHGWAGEIGHIAVDPTGPPCRCGSFGCLEQYAGLRALLAASGLPPTGSIAEVVARVHDGDNTAREAVAAAGRALGVALASAVNVLDVPAVVLGGHLAQAADVLKPVVERELGARVLSAHWHPVAVEVAAADVAAGATGAAYSMLNEVVDSPAHWVDAWS